MVHAIFSNHSQPDPNSLTSSPIFPSKLLYPNNQQQPWSHLHKKNILDELLDSSSDNESSASDGDNDDTLHTASPVLPETETEGSEDMVLVELVKDLSIMTTTSSYIRLPIEDPTAMWKTDS
eukprot:5493227-Ditylum_brightwellii.AAC.1